MSNTPKPYLVFRESFRGQFSIYKWNAEEQWWLLEDGSGNGFSLEKVNKYKDGSAFHQCDDKNEALEYVKYRKYAEKYGSRVKEDPDFACPKCGYHHRDDRDFEGYGDYPEEDFSVPCYCGHRIVVSTRLVYDVR